MMSEKFSKATAASGGSHAVNVTENQGSIDESGLKGGDSPIPSPTAGTEPGEKLSQTKCLEEYGSFHDKGNRP
jgi:hypothetical protein